MNNFVFSAHNLQDFVDCERRFELKYLLKQAWPAVQSEPVLEVERRIRIGREFHYMIHQFLSGIPMSALRKLQVDAEVENWLDQFEQFFGKFSFVRFQSELSVVQPHGDYYLTAIFDFTGWTSDQKAIIMDWKTSHYPLRREWIEKKVQSYLYPYLSYENRHQVFTDSEEIHCSDIEMLYWNASFPGSIVTLPYSENQHEENRHKLDELIGQITHLPMGKFRKTTDHKKCAYCLYRSLCQRGVTAGSIEAEAGEILDIDALISETLFEEGEEISF